MTGQAVAYIRVSSEEQAAHGGSLAMQRDRLADYCRLARLELVETIADEGISGSVPLGRRKGGRRLVKLVADGAATHVVALKLDRLFRDTANALNQTREWDKASVALHLVDMGGQAIDTSSAIGRVFITLLACFAEFERNVIGERTRAVLAHKRVNGEAYSPTPLGYRREGDRLVRDDDELRVVRLLKRWQADGWSLAKSAKVAQAQGLQTKRGGAWYPSTVRYLLGNRLYADVPPAERAAA